MPHGLPRYEEEGVASVASPWLLALPAELETARSNELFQVKQDPFDTTLCLGTESLWLLVACPEQGQFAFRTAYSPGGSLKLLEVQESETGWDVRLDSPSGGYTVKFNLLNDDQVFVRWTTEFTPKADLKLPFWPRDIYLLDHEGYPLSTQGEIHARQRGPTGGLMYLSLTQPATGSLFYFQNLTSLNTYSEKTGTSPAGRVGGDWPELGYSPAPALEKPLPAGEKVVLSDALIRIAPEIPRTDIDSARQFIDFYAEIYLQIPRPPTEYHPWPTLAESSLHDMTYSPKCYLEVEGQKYLRAYVSSIVDPPESMVQLAIILPLIEIEDWRGADIPLIHELLDTIPSFFDPNIDTLIRWLVTKQQEVKVGKEGQPNVRAMDSWYLYHPLLNLARLLLRGYKEPDLERLFYKTLEYGIKVAQHFDYTWPVFYNLDTLEVIRAESSPGKGGETDVGCLYTLVMMHAYELTKDKRYIQEAEKAAARLDDLGFNLAYQTNVVAFGLSGLWRLYQATGNAHYKDLTLVCLANLFHNMWMWESDFGLAKHYHTFFGASPLQDAPYLASYEELEILSVFHDYLGIVGDEIPDSACLLITEYCRFSLFTAWEDFPPNIKNKEIITEKPKSGEIDQNLFIPLEDLYDGLQKAGQVGQEIYGNGSPFTLTTRQYEKHPDMPFIFFCEYPTTPLEVKTVENGKIEVSAQSLGDKRLECDFRLIPIIDGVTIPEVEAVIVAEGKERQAEAFRTDEGHIRYRVPGNSRLVVRWDRQAATSKEKANQ